MNSAQLDQVYLTAVLEYLVAEILELAGNAARDHKKKRIAPRHLLLAIRNDDEYEFRGRLVALVQHASQARSASSRSNNLRRRRRSKHPTRPAQQACRWKIQNRVRLNGPLMCAQVLWPGHWQPFSLEHLFGISVNFACTYICTSSLIILDVCLNKLASCTSSKTK